MTQKNGEARFQVFRLPSRGFVRAREVHTEGNVTVWEPVGKVRLSLQSVLKDARKGSGETPVDYATAIKEGLEAPLEEESKEEESKEEDTTKKSRSRSSSK